MTKQDFFLQRPQIKPTIYVYELEGVASHKGYIKIGYTERDVKTRIEEQIGATHVPYKILYQESAMRDDGTIFVDHDVHNILERLGYQKLSSKDEKDNEWYKCTVKDVKAAIFELKTGTRFDGKRNLNFEMRPEQERAVAYTYNYYLNAKMRFGKTFASYELAKMMEMKRILILTFKPAVESAWREDLLCHVDFDGWQFISNKDAHNENINIDEQFEKANKRKPIVVFGSFQDLLGTNENGGIKAKNEFIHETNWDLVIFDEYHFGAWRESAKKLFEKEDEESSVDFNVEEYQKNEAGNAYNETFLPITTKYYLYLSGTPFKAINSGEFIEDQIFTWTYTEEQKAKESWKGSNNPYLALPRMCMLTYKVPDSISYIASQGEFNEFDLNLFFSAEGEGKNAKFKCENEVQKWLDLIRGSYLPANMDDLKLGQDKRPPMPFSDTRLLNVLSHTLWFLPNVASCYAMYNLLQQKQNTFYHDYKINICAGPQAGIGLDALIPVKQSMSDPLNTKTITLSCGKLTTGVTIRPWTGVFMLRNLTSPETYFQTAFRVQSPWEITKDDGTKEILKQECYIFDFALDRALRMISDYSCRLDTNESNPEKKVGDFIKFLPVLAYDGSTMKQVDAEEILDIAMSGTSATLLARRWESALLVNVDNDTLNRILNNPEALEALRSIEGFRALNSDLQTIINKSEKVKKAKQSKKLTDKQKKELTQEEKEYKSKRKEIQEKLIKFATRVPIFMYLTDYRERSLKDVITQLEPELFKKVTGLNVKDFELLCSIGVFNASLMNDAIFKFKRYEDASLSYAGINKHQGEDVGGWDTTIKKKEYKRLFYNQQTTLVDEHAYEIDEESGKEEIVLEDEEKYNEKNYKTINKSKTAKLPKIDVGDVVNHKKFGKGKIVKIDKSSKHIRVKFKAGEKNFVFPDAFVEGYIEIKV